MIMLMIAVLGNTSCDYVNDCCIREYLMHDAAIENTTGTMRGVLSGDNLSYTSLSLHHSQTCTIYCSGIPLCLC